MQKKEAGGLIISSPAFKNEGDIPSKYTCEGQNINPPLNIEGIPEEATSLVLVVEDPDAPRGTFDHWLVWNIEPTSAIGENTSPGISGKNSGAKTGYYGPCPPSGSHRYYFNVYALNRNIDLPAGSDRKALQEAMQSYIIAKGGIMGRYKKSR
jgi:Raf kinase inhibitor-like YbhB/YbcL family protein